MLTVGSLFAGIGGFDLGFARAGFDIKWQVEIDPFCRAVLAQHWPDVTRYDDIRTVRDLESVAVICGGFPCQDISTLGWGAGIDGEQSGLWRAMARVVRELRPRYVVVENSPALLGRGLGRVIGDLAACGYDAEWNCIPASVVGAPHVRDRLWILAYPAGVRRVEGIWDSPGDWHRLRDWVRGGADAWTHDRYDDHVPPGIVRMVDGLPARVDRLRGLGNAIVPQIAEWIARRILAAEGLTATSPATSATLAGLTAVIRPSTV